MTSFLERYLKKTRPEDITYRDFLNFYQQRVEEHQTLEYKPRGLLVRQDDTIINPKDDREIVGFSALAKIIAGFANAEGGLLVLGVKERPEKYRGQVVKILPGAISALPINVTREIIENQLLVKIQYPIEGVTIVPLRSSSRSKQLIYLIDVPQSIRVPHRVNEIYYFQRYNFSTLEMKHFQIADMFGRRLAPNLDIEIQRVQVSNKELGSFMIYPVIRNSGRAVAKYVTCICSIVSGPYRMVGHFSWQGGENSRQFSTGFNSVVYPDIGLNTNYIEFELLPNSEAELLILNLGIYAEGMQGKQSKFSLDPKTIME